jgi:hypothetical protein
MYFEPHELEQANVIQLAGNGAEGATGGSAAGDVASAAAAEGEPDAAAEA